MRISQNRTFILLAYLIGFFLQTIAQDGGSQSTNTCPDIKPNVSQNFYIRTFNKIGIALDNEFCSNVGRDIILKNGSAVDAAIAAGLCNGLMNAQSAGIGGGQFMVIYLKDRRVAYSINSREKAPMNAYETMFANRSSLKGGLATAIPGEISGYWEAYKLGGRLPWSTLIQPAIDMCLNGYKVSPTLANWMNQYESQLMADPNLNRVFINPITNKAYKAGDTIRNIPLGYTFQMIAGTNVSQFYNGSLAKMMVTEINDAGGNVTDEDFRNYEAMVSDAVEVDLDDNHVAYVHPIPSSGILVPFIMRIMRGYNLTSSIFNSQYQTTLFYHRLIESFKHAYAHRALFGDQNSPELSELLTQLKDENYIASIRNKINDTHTYPSPFYSNITFKNDHGTTHVSIIANGDAVAFTSTINTYFGALYAGRYTGIIYNNQMDDFSSPNMVNAFGFQPSEANYIRPGKRPMSSMSPTIIVDRKTREPKLVIGASGGSKIIAAVAQVAIKTLWMDMNIKDAIDDMRVHHQLYPTAADFETGFDSEIRKSLQLYGHEETCYPYGSSVVQGVHRFRPGSLDSYSDPRKGGIPAGI